MTINPELRRNLWLEITLTRLIGAPLVLGAIFYLAGLTKDTAAVAFVAVGLYLGLVFLWGVRLASESITSEIRERTWDWQRMSSLSPWAMTWGKLLGSTAFTWYGGTICLLTYVATSRLDHATCETLGTLVVGGLFVQAFGMFCSLQAVIKNRTVSRSQSAAFMLLALGALGPYLGIRYSSETVRWYGLLIRSTSFGLVSLFVFWAWAVAGVVRLMRRELKYRSLPLIWAAFVVFLMFFAAGFDLGQAYGSFSQWLVGLVVAAALTLITILAERKDPVALKRLLQAAKRHEWRRVLEDVPAWVVSFTAVVLTAVVLLAARPILPNARAVDLFVAASVLFLARDLGLVLFLNLSPRPKRADMFAVLCLGLLYGIIPAILSALELETASALFWPRGGHAITSTLAAALECALVFALVARRWRRGVPLAQ